MDPLSLLRSATNARYKHLEESYDKKEPGKALAQVTYLSLDQKGIQFIENLEHCVNLSCLYLSDNQIRSLKNSFVGHTFKNLVQISLDDNLIVRIEGLEVLTNLRKLYIERNCISRLEGLG